MGMICPLFFLLTEDEGNGLGVKYMMISDEISGPLIPQKQVEANIPGLKMSGPLNDSYNFMDLPPGTPTSRLAVLENLFTTLIELSSCKPSQKSL